MTQCEEILKYMKTNDGITSMEAILWIQCTRLAARISELEARGYKIRHVRVKDGRKVFTRYFLEEVKKDG